MNCLLENEILSNWLLQYGSIALFILLTVGIVILPVPEETLMVVAGILMKNGNLNIITTVLAAYIGSICGITISYLLGRTVGHYLINKYGGWIGATPSRLERIHQWFERFGKWTLSFGYFIPGVRHFTGFVSGLTELDYKQFALFAYTGALLWVSTFLSIGYFFSHYCLACFEALEIELFEIMVFCLIFVILYLLYSKFRRSPRT